DETLKEITSPLLSLPFAFNPLIHRMCPAQTLFDFAFVGTNSPIKQAATLDYLVPIVRNYVGVLAGTGWPGRFGCFSQEEAGFLYNFAAICPNYHLRNQIENYSEVNERTHVLQACGAFQLCDSPMAIRALYDEDELITAENPGEFQQLFSHYLSNPAERGSIVARGMTKAWGSYSQFAALQPLIEHVSANL
ncbi:MAG: glycosyltransferase, partial [Candidatus Zixiibacteriota bacterium]